MSEHQQETQQASEGLGMNEAQPFANLLPKSKRAERRVRGRVRMWSGIITCWALLCVGAIAMLGYRSVSSANAAREIADLRQRIATTEQSISSTAADVDRMIRKMELHAEVEPSPPWDHLIGALGVKLEDRISVERVLVQETLGGRTIDLTGVAPTPIAASEAVLALEETGYFDGPLTATIGEGESQVLITIQGVLAEVGS